MTKEDKKKFLDSYGGSGEYILYEILEKHFGEIPYSVISSILNSLDKRHYGVWHDTELDGG